MHILRLLDPKVKAYFQTLDATSVAPKDLMYTCSELWLFPCQLFFFLGRGFKTTRIWTPVQHKVDVHEGERRCFTSLIMEMVKSYGCSSAFVISEIFCCHLVLFLI